MSVPSLAINDGHCLSVMTMTSVLLPCAGEKGLSAAASLDPLRARSQCRSHFTWPSTVAFQGLSPSQTRGQRCVCCADCKTLGDKGSFPRGVLTYPAVLPSASCIQLADLQLSQLAQVQMFLLLTPPLAPACPQVQTGMYSMVPF